jgi:phosphatidylglycerophosphate synthase
VPARGSADVTTTRAEYFARWSASHGGYDPTSSPFVSRWLVLVHACARPLVRLRIAPSVVTVCGLGLAAAAVPAAAAGAGWLYLAFALVLASGLVDGLDGAVAVLSGRASAVGYVLDSVVDRVSDLLYLVVLWQVGAPAGVCVVAGALMFLHEYLRARATAAGMTEVGVVTVWERPTRVVVTAVALLGAAVFHGAVLWSGPGDRQWATGAAWVWVGLGVVGLVQLSVVVVRRLSGRGPVAPG